MTIKLMKTKDDLLKILTKLDNFIYEFGEKIL
jgi:hypothetical protein